MRTLGGLWHCEDAPTAASTADIALVVSAFVQDHHGRVLLRRGDDGLWTLPGGPQAGEESLGQTAMRHVAEQTGIAIQVLGLVGIYADRVGVDDEADDRLTLCLRARPQDTPRGTSSDIRWVAADQLEAASIDESVRRRIGHGLKGRADAFIDRRARQRIAARSGASPARWSLAGR